MSAELYTSLVRLKRAVNGGRLPPVTPLSPEAETILDAAFTPGMGAIEESAETGLRCPVIGCGKYFRDLGRHLDATHCDIGGAARVREVLSIPRRYSLMSAKLRAERAAIFSLRRGATRAGRELDTNARDRLRLAATKGRATQARKRALRKSKRKSSYVLLNMRDRCDVQVGHMLIDLHHELGRSPSKTEAIARHGDAFVQAILAVYGSWNNAKALLGLEARKPGKTRWLTLEAVIEGLRAWHDAHGELPSVTAAMRRNRSPLIGSHHTILGAFNTPSWPDAMRQAAALLDIHGGRYGLPAKEPIAEAV